MGSIRASTFLLVTLALSAQVLPAQVGAARRTGTPVIRPAADPTAGLLRRARLRNGNAGSRRHSLTTAQKTAAMVEAGYPQAVLSAPFRLSPDSPVASGGRGHLHSWRATALPSRPNGLSPEPIIAVYDQFDSSDDLSLLTITIFTRPNTRYLVDCQVRARMVYLGVGDTQTAFPGTEPMTFVIEATPNPTAVLVFTGRGETNLGYWMFYGCDITPSAA